MNDKQSNTNEVDLIAWQTIRTSIGTFNTVVLSLLTQASALMFAAFGIIYSNSQSLGFVVTFLLGIGTLVGVLMLHLGVCRFVHSIEVSVASALRLEVTLFGNDASDPRRITHLLSVNPLAAASNKGRRFYRTWSLLLFLISLCLSLGFLLGGIK